MKKYLRIFTSLFLILGIAISCKEKSLPDDDKNLLYVNAYDTVAKISFPNYLSLDTNYTWDDYSDCPCCGRLKTRFQNKKDSTFNEHGFFWLKRPPKYRTYVTFIFPQYLKCFERSNADTSELRAYEKAICENLLENDFENYKAKKIIDFSYTNNKLQRVTAMGVSTFNQKKGEINATIYVSTFNTRNNFLVIIKFEQSARSNISEFVHNSLRTIHQIEIK